VPPVSGTYRLGVDGFSGYKLTLDGELLAEYTNIHHPALRSGAEELEGGRFYSLCLEYVSRGLDPQARLLWAPPDRGDELAALEAAGTAEVIVAVKGLPPRLQGEEMPVKVDGFAGGDRTRIELPSLKEAFVKKLHGLGGPVVLVLLNGSALAIPWAAAGIAAILEPWCPGQAGGEALADVLFGEYNPGGQLPITFYESTADLPAFDDYDMAGRTCRFFRGKPLFPFGHGLSYTAFELGDLQIHPGHVTIGQQVVVSVKVANTGGRAGDAVVQLYVRHPEAAVPRPIQELKGFKRIHLGLGESKTVTFTVHSHQLGYYDEDMRYAVHPGPVDLLVGHSSEDLPLAGRLEIVGERTRVDKAFFSHAGVE
jgi:beta-glucosidase